MNRDLGNKLRAKPVVIIKNRRSKIGIAGKICLQKVKIITRNASDNKKDKHN